MYKRQSNRGFTVLELLIAAVILAIALTAIVGVAVSSVKNASFSRHDIDSQNLLSNKSSLLLTNLTSELSKFPKNATQVGSIDPQQVVAGYYDLLNDSGCVIQSSKTLINNLDCSASTSPNPIQSTTPKFRRQWAIKKDYPYTGDVTIGVTIIYIQSNEIVRTLVRSKTDGLTSK